MLPGWWPQVRLIHLCTSPLVFEGGRGCGTSALQWDTEEENGGQLWGYLGWSAEAQPAQPSRGTSDPPVWPHEAQSDFSVRRVGGGGGEQCGAQRQQPALSLPTAHTAPSLREAAGPPAGTWPSGRLLAGISAPSVHFSAPFCFLSLRCPAAHPLRSDLPCG